MKKECNFTIEIKDEDIYTTYIGDMSIYSGVHRDSDFVGNYYQCIEYIKQTCPNGMLHGDLLRAKEIG